MGRRRSRKRRSASVQLARSATGSRVDSLMTMLLGARLFASMRERRDERHDEEEDHPEDHQQVRDRDQDERPVQVRGRRIHAGHLLTSAFSSAAGAGADVPAPPGAPVCLRRGASPQPTTRRCLSPVPLLSYLCRDGPTGAVAEYADETGYIRRRVWHLRRKLEEDPKRTSLHPQRAQRPVLLSLWAPIVSAQGDEQSPAQTWSHERYRHGQL